jgi:geranylgeranyl pyrophosphate synthase
VSHGFDLSAFLAREVEHVDAALERALEAPEMSALPSDVRAAVGHGVRSGGKRLRPILCVQGWAAAAGGDPASTPAAYDLATSLELIHAYSLMHDDLPCMDDAELRRGAPTTHRVHGVAATVRGGVALIPLAASQALRSARALGCDDARAARVSRHLLGAAGNGGMVGGQGLDLLGEDRALTSAELDELHAHKTGALLTAALTMGAEAAAAGPEVQDGLRRYGRHIGLAFQIADDVLDATATAAELGKEPSDAELGKSTYVTLHGIDEARRRGEAEIDAALAALDAAGVAAPPLRALARYVVERDR